PAGGGGQAARRGAEGFGRAAAQRPVPQARAGGPAPLPDAGGRGGEVAPGPAGEGLRGSRTPGKRLGGEGATSDCRVACPRLPYGDARRAAEPGPAALRDPRRGDGAVPPRARGLAEGARGAGGGQVPRRGAGRSLRRQAAALAADEGGRRG